jgi:hypothetical protein
MKENCIMALIARLEKYNEELMFEKKMTAELHALRMVLMQGGNLNRL